MVYLFVVVNTFRRQARTEQTHGKMESICYDLQLVVIAKKSTLHRNEWLQQKSLTRLIQLGYFFCTSTWQVILQDTARFAEFQRRYTPSVFLGTVEQGARGSRVLLVRYTHLLTLWPKPARLAGSYNTGKACGGSVKSGSGVIQPSLSKNTPKKNIHTWNNCTRDNHENTITSQSYWKKQHK